MTCVICGRSHITLVSCAICHRDVCLDCVRYREIKPKFDKDGKINWIEERWRIVCNECL